MSNHPMTMPGRLLQITLFCALSSWNPYRRVGIHSRRSGSPVGVSFSRSVTGATARWSGPLPAGGLPGHRRVRSVPGGDFGEAGQAPAGADGIAHLLPALALTFKVPVGEHHPGARGFLGAESDLDLAGLGRVG